MRVNKWLYYWGPVVVWAGVIFTFSSIPTLPKVGFIWWDFVLKKTAHMIEYATLFFLVWRALKKSGQFAADCQWVWIFLGCLIYAASDEFHQSFVMGRTSTIRDVGFDFLGMMLAWLAIKKDWLPKKLYV